MTENALPVLPVSLIIVSDYLTPDGDEELRRAVRAYAQDPRGVPAEIIIMLPQRHTSKIASELDGKPAFLLRIPEFSGALAADDPAAFKASTQYR